MLIALFWRRLGARATALGMVASVVTLNLIHWPATLPATREAWLRLAGGEVFWPWYTLIGTLVTLGVAAVTARVTRSSKNLRFSATS
jgi:Na+/proline symporter